MAKDLDENEFTEILSFLMDTDLVVLYQVFLVDEKEQHGTLRKLRDNISVYSQLYNAYTARVLVSDPILYVKNEMVRRFTGLNGKLNSRII